MDDEQISLGDADQYSASLSSYANVAGIRPHIAAPSPRTGGNMRRPDPILYGNARSNDGNADQQLAADVELAAYGVSKDATEVQLKDFISSKGIRVVDVKKLTTYEHARTNTFKVCIKASDYDKALKPEVWPLRVGVRLFRPKRNTQTWAQQSAASGGNIKTSAGQSQEIHADKNLADRSQVVPPVTPVSTSNRFALLGEIGVSSGPYSQN